VSIFAFRRVTLLLLAQKKVTKEKSTPAACFLRFSLKRAAAELASLRQSSPKTPALAAMLGAAAGELTSKPCECRYRLFNAKIFQILRHSRVMV
jgi:hypothetical protein